MSAERCSVKNCMFDAFLSSMCQIHLDRYSVVFRRVTRDDVFHQLFPDACEHECSPCSVSKPGCDSC